MPRKIRESQPTDKGRYSSKVTFLRHNTTQLNTHSKQTQSIYEFC